VSGIDVTKLRFGPNVFGQILSANVGLISAQNEIYLLMTVQYHGFSGILGSCVNTNTKILPN
jgi:hypothetical protein